MAAGGEERRLRRGRATKRRTATRDWGTLRRLRPLSPRYGNDRGTPVNRYLIRQFLGRNAQDVRGSVLEVREDYYSSGLGGDRVDHLTVVDIDRANLGATLYADLAEPGSLPSDAFDCVLVTQVLQFVSDVGAAAANIFQSLRTPGVALITVPGMARIDPDEYFHDRWRFLGAGLRATFTENCPGSSIQVAPYGNVMTATAFLMGAAAEELEPAELDYLDARFPVIWGIRVAKEKQ
jgi:SAM-dependent methyltransferase